MTKENNNLIKFSIQTINSNGVYQLRLSIKYIDPNFKNWLYGAYPNGQPTSHYRRLLYFDFKSKNVQLVDGAGKCFINLNCLTIYPTNTNNGILRLSTTNSICYIGFNQDLLLHYSNDITFEEIRIHKFNLIKAFSLLKLKYLKDV